MMARQAVSEVTDGLGTKSAKIRALADAAGLEHPGSRIKRPPHTEIVLFNEPPGLGGISAKAPTLFLRQARAAERFFDFFTGKLGDVSLGSLVSVLSFRIRASGSGLRQKRSHTLNRSKHSSRAKFVKEGQMLSKCQEDRLRKGF
jgi:hypothetical protein